MSKKINIDQLVIRLEHWRSQKSYKGEAIPPKLVASILEAANHYPLPELKRKLKVKNYQIKSWREERGLESQTSIVRVSSPFRPTLSLEETPPIEILRPDGVLLKIHPRTSDESRQIIDSFIIGGGR